MWPAVGSEPGLVHDTTGVAIRRHNVDDASCILPDAPYRPSVRLRHWSFHWGRGRTDRVCRDLREQFFDLHRRVDDDRLFSGLCRFLSARAADTASPAFRSKAISLVLAGGVFAALAGPELSKWSYDLFMPMIYAGCFIAIACVQSLSFAFLYFVDIPTTPRPVKGVDERPFSVILRQPIFLTAAIGAMIGYGVMTFVMTATPLAIMACGYEFSDAAFVIQWHILAMYAPSFFTGSLIQRFGVRQVMLTGAIILAGAVGVNTSGIDIERFWLGLVLLGVGWNFMFVAERLFLLNVILPKSGRKCRG